jgi:hypothetical protein
MAAAVYLLCALTSVGCAALLIRGYRRSPTRLALWTSACFALLAVNNVLLFLDRVVLPDIDLGMVRKLTAIAGLAVLVFGLIWEDT